MGILGGGHLSRMMTQAASRVGVRVAIADGQGSSSPAGQISSLCIHGNCGEVNTVQELGQISDIFMIEEPQVPSDVLEVLEASPPTVHPNPRTVRLIQDKYLLLSHMAQHQIPVADVILCSTYEKAIEAGVRFGYPMILRGRYYVPAKHRTSIVNSELDLEEAIDAFRGTEVYGEKFLSVAKELNVTVVRSKSDLLTYPVAETIKQNDIDELVIAPAQISQRAQLNALQVAQEAIASLEGASVYAVKLFLLVDDSVILRDISPFPDSSGLYTIESCNIDQFEMHLRAVLGWPCSPPKMLATAAATITVAARNSFEETRPFLHKALEVSGVRLHWYGRHEGRFGQKLAHISIVSNSIEELGEKLEMLAVNSDTHGVCKKPRVRVGIIMEDDSDLSVMQEAAIILDRFQISHELTVVSAHNTPTRVYTYAQSAAERGIQVIIAGAEGTGHLPGMTAALTSLPVISVPIVTATSRDTESWKSFVLSSSGNPVANVSVNNATNAGLLAVRILGAQDPELLKKMDEFLLEKEERELKKVTVLDSIGYKEYLRHQSNESAHEYPK